MKKQFLLISLALLLFAFSSKAQVISNQTKQYPDPAVLPGSINNLIIRMEIEVGSTPAVIRNMVFNTNGSTNPLTDIVNSKLWYTNSDSVFNLNNAILLETILNPWFTNFEFLTSPSDTLNPGNHYFWLTYDVAIGAAVCNSLDAGMVSFYTNSTIVVASNPTTPGHSVIGLCTSLIEENEIYNVSVSPNPAIDFVLLKGYSTNNEQLSVQLFDVFGKKVADCYNEKPGSGDFEIQIPLDEISPGMYSMVLVSGNAMRTLKLLKL